MDKILLDKNKSKRSVNIENNKHVELINTTKVLPYENIIDKVNLYSVFENERRNSDTYRLMFTINPICSNVLFNLLTEVVRYEGSDKVDVLENPVNGVVKNPVQLVGLATNPNESIDYSGGRAITRYQAVRNTEYSNKKCGFTYHCGYDIFNNHLLRSNTFKSVSKYTGSETDKLKSFNTLFDYLRKDDGDILTFSFRYNDTGMTTNSALHLYEYEDVSQFFETIDKNLIEQNGWFGFTNIMKAKTSASQDDDSSINKTINSAKACEFIDMYPDRTLYSFSPKVNQFRKRIEKNWNYCLTYPYSSTKNHVLINKLSNGEALQEDGNYFYNGILIDSVIKSNSSTGDEIVLFKCSFKHNLKRGDKFTLIDDITSTKIGTTFTVLNVGNEIQQDKKYTFYIGYDDIRNYLNINDFNRTYRIRRHVNGYDSEYYIRIFRKLPNFKYSKEKVTEENMSNIDDYNRIIEDNTIEFENSIYQLAFSNNIYTDNQTQITFTDDVHINYLKDNLGRPLTELYLTIIKNNSGYKEWYGTKENNYTPNYRSNNVEFSHCFGEVTSGFNLPYEINNKELSNVHYLTNVSAKSSSASVPLEREIGLSGTTKGDNIFYGDIVEFNYVEAIENVIEPVFYRFNTQQRETDNPMYTYYQYDDIVSDDYDIRGGAFTSDGFSGLTTSDSNKVNGLSPNQRPEGYYYKAHYKIPVRGFGDTIQQANASELKITKAEQIGSSSQYNITTQTVNYIEKGEYIMLSELVNGRETEPLYCKVIETKTLTTFIMNSPINILEGGKTFILRRRNYSIPSYANNLRDGTGRYVWRDVYSVGENPNINLEEYPFTNGAFYIQKNINFFLLRQDPFGKSGLYASGHKITDKQGNKNDISNYEYFEENERIC